MRRLVATVFLGAPGSLRRAAASLSFAVGLRDSLARFEPPPPPLIRAASEPVDQVSGCGMAHARSPVCLPLSSGRPASGHRSAPFACRCRPGDEEAERNSSGSKAGSVRRIGGTKICTSCSIMAIIIAITAAAGDSSRPRQNMCVCGQRRRQSACCWAARAPKPGPARLSGSSQPSVCLCRFEAALNPRESECPTIPALRLAVGRPAGWLTDGRQPFKFNTSESSFGRNLLLYLCASLRCCAAGSESGQHHKLYLVNANLAPARRALSLCCASSSPYSTSSSSAAVAAAPSSHCLAQKLTLSCGDGEANHHHRLIRTLHKLSPAQQQPHHPQIVCRLCEENCRVLTGSSPGLGASLFH